MGSGEQIVAPGTLLPPIEAEFIDQPCGLESTDFDSGVNCFLLPKLSIQDTAPPLPSRCRSDPFYAAEQIASCCCLTDPDLL